MGANVTCEPSLQLMACLTHERLLELLDYDPATGVFRWRVSPNNRVKVGSVAGAVRPDGYSQIRIDGKRYMLSRLAVFYVEGKWPTKLVDHKNRTRTDARYANLRHATQQQNCANRSLAKNNSTGLKGVHYDASRGLYRVRIMRNGVRRSLGFFVEKEAAGAAYNDAAVPLDGEFTACL
jgi:hypothetical protein